MGLDTFAKIGANTDHSVVKVIKEEDGKERMVIKASIYAKVGALCGGMFSGNGTGGSFRGKVYSEFVEEVTGESLYQENITNSVVEDMATDLRLTADEYADDKDDKVVRFAPYEITVGEVRALADWFEVTAENGLEICGWW